MRALKCSQWLKNKHSFVLKDPGIGEERTDLRDIAKTALMELQGKDLRPEGKMAIWTTQNYRFF